MKVTGLSYSKELQIDFFGDTLNKSRDLKNTIGRSKIVLKEIARERDASKHEFESHCNSKQEFFKINQKYFYKTLKFFKYFDIL
jgi:hypothetical protein